MNKTAYDIKAERAVRKRSMYFHVTDVKNIKKIQRKGLLANEEGHIFVFTDRIVADPIAQGQCFLNEYALFAIYSKGITGKVIRDRVAEFTASYHRIIIQKHISGRHMFLWGTYKINENEPSRWDLLKMKRLEGLSKEDATKVFYKRRAALLECPESSLEKETDEGVSNKLKNLLRRYRNE